MINWQRFDDINKLKYFSALQCYKENSSFGCRLSLAQSYTLYSYITQSSCYTQTIDEIIYNGVLSLEDPQENTFIGVVNSHTASYRVFLSNIEGVCQQLSRLLCIADVLHVNSPELDKAKFLLSLSEEVARRYNCKRYELGMPEQIWVTEPSNIDISGVVFSKSEITKLLQDCNLASNSYKEFIFSNNANDIIYDLEYKHFPDCIERSPLFQLSDNEIVLLQPSALLRLAFLITVHYMESNLSANGLYLKYNIFMSEIVRMTCEPNKCNVIFKYEEDENGRINLWGIFDGDKIANIMISLPDSSKKIDCEDFQEETIQKIHKIFPNHKIVNFLIWDDLQPDTPSTITSPADCMAWQIDDFEIAMSNSNYSLLELYYYYTALSKENYDKLHFQQLDYFSFYKNNKSTFYTEQIHNYICVEIGMALKLRAEFYSVQDYHIAPFRNNTYVGLQHYVELPDDIPVYTIRHRLELGIYIAEIGGKKISIRYVDKSPLLKEIMKSILCLFVGFSRYYSNDFQRKDVYIYLTKSQKEKAPSLYKNVNADNEYKFVIPENYLECKFNEKEVFATLIDSLITENVISVNVPQTTIVDYLNSIQGGFISFKEFDDFLEVKSLEGCYTLNENYLDRIMDEIADFINWESGYTLLSKKDSLNILYKTLDFLEKEIDNLLNSIDSEYLIDRLLELYSTTIFWTRTSESRYYALNRAYNSIGSSFKSKSGFENNYVTTKILIQALVGWIVCKDFRGDKKCSIENIDRLFALTSTYITIGSHIDLLNGNVTGSEFAILDNGRLSFPREAMAKLNRFFEAMNNEVRISYDMLKRKNLLLPEFELDFKSNLFVDAYISEYGFEYQEYLKVIGNCWEYAYKTQQSVVVMSVECFKEKMLSHLTLLQIDSFFNKCVLSSQTSLNREDNYVQQYNRQSQLTSRPWVYFNGKIFYTSNALVESQSVITERFYTGKFIAKSEKMQALKAEICDKKGKHFTNCIANLFTNNSHIEVYTEQNIKPGARLNATKDIGDIDILIINKLKKLIVCIEAKNYVECHTVHEAMMRIKDLKNQNVFEKVYNRDMWCKDNILIFTRICPEVTEEYKCKTIFLTYNNMFLDETLETRLNKSDIIWLTALELIDEPSIIFDR